jgi:hypothetical protein
MSIIRRTRPMTAARRPSASTIRARNATWLACTTQCSKRRKAAIQRGQCSTATQSASRTCKGERREFSKRALDPAPQRIASLRWVYRLRSDPRARRPWEENLDRLFFPFHTTRRGLSLQRGDPLNQGLLSVLMSPDGIHQRPRDIHEMLDLCRLGGHVMLHLNNQLCERGDVA